MIAVISDVHGNYPALKAVMDEINLLNPDMIISLGDIAGYYCFINECIELCRENNVINIMGNHDYYLVSGSGCPRSYSANVCLKYQMDVITEDNLRWLSNSIELYDTDAWSFRHGGWNDPLDEYLYEFSFENVKEYKQKIFASGHTHKQVLLNNSERIYFNPGSVGQPRDYDSRAAYAVIRNNTVELKRCKYNIVETISGMHELGFDKRFSDCLRYGTKIGEIK